MINLKIKKLVIKKDERGWLAELIKPEDVGVFSFGQINLTVATKNQTKGNHYHLRKREWFCVLRGKGLLKVWDRNNTQRKEVEMGEGNMVLVEIPVGYFHSITNTGDDELYVLACVNEAFNPQDPDTFYE
jgi:UDP-2-acetamido-2,6-beta-L-arabino-hexul-4-ose reductase